MDLKSKDSECFQASGRSGWEAGSDFPLANQDGLSLPGHSSLPSPLELPSGAWVLRAGAMRASQDLLIQPCLKTGHVEQKSEIKFPEFNAWMLLRNYARSGLFELV